MWAISSPEIVVKRGNILLNVLVVQSSSIKFIDVTG